MRLLDVHQLKLKEFPNEKTRPSYAILSHTWGDGEVSLQDLQTPSVSSMAGYAKIKKCCEVAIEDGFEYIWIDTCCIDKTSSAELSEAINSMYIWYQSASVCYAYLSDMRSEDNPSGPHSSFSKSRWFTRGWTLQELLAPEIVMFYDRNWVDIGTKSTLQGDISRITGIPPSVLSKEKNMHEFSIAQRMSWAAKRETTRVEDTAYCLIGIFDVNMPTLYGEGKRAFIRLQYEIMKVSDDHSLFAWVYEKTQYDLRSRILGICDSDTGCRMMRDRLFAGYDPSYYSVISGLLSSSPRYFEYSQGVSRMDGLGRKRSFSMTNNGLHIWLPMVRVPGLDLEIYQVILDCGILDGDGALTVFFKRHNTGQYSRILPTVLCTSKNLSYDPERVELYVKEDYLEKSEPYIMGNGINYQFRLVENSSPNKGYILLGASNPQILQKKMFNLNMRSSYLITGIAYIIVRPQHDPSTRVLVALAVLGFSEFTIMWKVRTGEESIERAIALFDKYGNNQPSASQFREDFRPSFQIGKLGERIIQKLPSGQIISVTFRKGPELSDRVQKCRMTVEFATPPLA